MVIQGGMMIVWDPLIKRKVDSVVKSNVGGENVLQLNANVILIRLNFRLQSNVKLTIGAIQDIVINGVFFKCKVALVDDSFVSVQLHVILAVDLKIPSGRMKN
jgi:hypothetical protein